MKYVDVGLQNANVILIETLVVFINDVDIYTHVSCIIILYWYLF